jgi:hypothetical protein
MVEAIEFRRAVRERANMTDAILISANLTMVDIDDALHHLESNKELYWSVMFPIRTERFRFPIYAFIHISGGQVEYRALVDRIIPFSPAVFDGPLAEHVKPPSFRDLWKSSRIERERPWKNDLVFTEIVPFSFDTRRFEMYKGGLVSRPKQGYIRVISPNETESFAAPLRAQSPQRAQPPQRTLRPQRPIAETNLEDFVIQQLEKIEAGLRLEGRQLSTPAGRLDLLCRDKAGNYVVVELKNTRGSDQVVGQILRYMGWVKEKYPQHEVRGIIIVGQIDDALRYAIKAIPTIEAKEFILSIA